MHNTVRKIFRDATVYKWARGVWSSINQRAINGKYINAKSLQNNPQHMSYRKKGVRLEMTDIEFYTFVDSKTDEILEIMKTDKASIDRIDNEGNYSIDNIQIIPLYVNMTKDSVSRKYSRRENITFKVNNRIQYLKNHNYVVERPINLDYFYDTVKSENNCQAVLIDAIKLGIIKNPFENGIVLNDCEDLIAFNNLVSARKEKELSIKKEKELVIEAKVAKKIASINEKELKLSNKLKRKNIKLHDRYDEVYRFIMNRKHKIRKDYVRIPLDIDEYIKTHSTREAVIYMIDNEISIKKPSILDIRCKDEILSRGVSYDSKNGKYIAQFNCNNVKYHLGRFLTQEEAIKAINDKKAELKIK